MLKTEDYFWRHEVVLTLEKIGPGAREAAPALRAVLDDRVGYIRVAAAVALLKVAPESETEIPPDLLKQARAKIEQDEAAAARAGGHTTGGAYIPDRGTKWDEASDLLSRGLQFYKQGNLDAAVASFTEALEVDPQYADAYHHRGVVRRGRGDYAAAVADFTEIIKLNAYNADAYYYRGLAHQRRGSLDAAVADYDRALKIVPPATRAFGARGEVKLTQGKAADALADFAEAVKADPKDAANHERLGDAHARLGDAGKARDAWKRALSLSGGGESKTRLEAKLRGERRE